MMKTLYHQMSHWYKTPLGDSLVEVECNGLHRFVQEIFGYYLLQLGGPRQADFLAASPIGHKIHFDSELLSSFHNSTVQGKFTELPFLSDSIDVIVAAHVLEFIKQPQEVLNEIYHILIPEGHVIIIGFNPFSLWGLKHLFKRRNIAPWGGKFISISRLRHWLLKLGFNIIEHKTFFFRPPLLSNKALRETLFMEKIGQVLWRNHGAVYILIAKKSVTALTPIKQKQQLIKQHVTATSPYAKPTTRV